MTLCHYWVWAENSPVTWLRSWAGKAQEGWHGTTMLCCLSGCLGFCLSKCIESLGLSISRKRKDRETLRWHCHVFLYFPIKVPLLLLQVVEIRMERSMFSVHMCWFLFNMAPRDGSLLGHWL